MAYSSVEVEWILPAWPLQNPKCACQENGPDASSETGLEVANQARSKEAMMPEAAIAEKQGHLMRDLNKAATSSAEMSCLSGFSIQVWRSVWNFKPLVVLEPS